MPICLPDSGVEAEEVSDKYMWLLKALLGAEYGHSQESTDNSAQA